MRKARAWCTARAFLIACGSTPRGVAEDLGAFIGKAPVRVTRMIRADEIRIKRSQLFENNPAKGQTPRIAIVMPDGEEHKHIQSLSLIYDGLIRARLERDSCVVALGGLCHRIRSVLDPRGDALGGIQR